jgi:hypothetical protein
MCFSAAPLRERPWQHEFGLEDSAGFPDQLIQCDSHPGHGPVEWPVKTSMAFAATGSLATGRAKPCRKALLRETNLPCAVFGPVLRQAFRLFAARRRSETIIFGVREAQHFLFPGGWPEAAGALPKAAFVLAPHAI